MSEHSPLPWFVPVHLDGPTITNSEGLIADIDLSLTVETDSANAAYIVRACNAYPELLAVAKMAGNAQEHTKTGLKEVARSLLAKLGEVL